MRNYQPEFEREAERIESEQSFSLSHAVAAIHRYRTVILLSLLALALLEVILGVTVYLLGPSAVLTRVPFRLEFAGADRGIYPNGLKFSSTEVVAGSVLSKVHEQNQLGRFATFDQFKNAVFISESNKTLDALSREYQAKLSDPRLTQVDRERIEKEFELKRSSLAHSDFSLNLSQSDNALRSMPRALVEKSLKDAIAIWSDQVMHDKGVLEYRLPVVTRSILDDRMLASTDRVAQVDILRTNLMKVLTNIDQMLLVPGAEVLRTKPPERISLSEIRINLENTLRFHIEPLFDHLRENGLVDNPGSSLSYVRAQIDYTDRRVQEEQGRVQAMRDSFSAYLQKPVTERHPQTTNTSPAAGAAQTVMPQLSENFVDQIVRMVTESRDIEYRQATSREIAAAVTTRVLPIQAEATYYRQLAEKLRALQARRGAAGSAAEQTFNARYATAVSDLRSAVEQTGVIYKQLSENLNPGNVVYSFTGPVEYAVARAVSGPRLILYGVLLFFLAIPLVIAVCLFHNRIREEEEVETRFHKKVSEPAAELSSR